MTSRTINALLAPIQPAARASAAVAATLLLAGGAMGQSAFAPLFSNGSANSGTPALNPRPTATNGAPAPAGMFWSETASISATESNAIGGFSVHALAGTPGNGFRFADDFVVPPGGGWKLGGVDVFAYQVGADGAAGSPIGSATLRIWNGRPGAVGSTVVFGDTTTNRLEAGTATNLLRIFTQRVGPIGATPDSARLVWRARLTLPDVALSPGTYWLDWQLGPTAANGVLFAPPVTRDNARTAPGDNSLQQGLDGVWRSLVDQGKPAAAPSVFQDLPFVLLGGQTCFADYNADGVLNTDDLSDYITDYFSQPAIAAGASPGGYGAVPCPGAPAPFDTLGYRADVNGDCLINTDDLSDYITLYFTGC